MASKFKEEKGNNESFRGDMGINIVAYIGQYSPEILKYESIMETDSAIGFFTKTFQPSQYDEGKRMMKVSVNWPYANRIIYLARCFLKLSEDHQKYIIDAAKQKIWWRGDNIENFRLIVEETVDFRQLSKQEKEVYRNRIFKMATSLGTRHAIT